MNPSMAGAAGEIISTTSDLNRFFRALATGRLLRPVELQQMTDPGSSGFGLGVEIATLDCGVRIIGHGGGGPGFVGLAFTTADGSRQLSLTAAVWGPDRDTLTARVIGAEMRVLYAAFCPTPQ
ncbi:serine hydrolase [Dactylosporangium sp. CA-233914]|uniref:serine hydrolase n=1 Tax=Dactylosporangium sp. CA-233914 TaxID=3239934 RepID=UPI003D900C5F